MFLIRFNLYISWEMYSQELPHPVLKIERQDHLHATRDAHNRQG
jgi:hypothetical protein